MLGAWTAGAFATLPGGSSAISFGFAIAGVIKFTNSPSGGWDRAAVMTAVRTRLGTVAIDCHSDLGATVTFSGSEVFGAACASAEVMSCSFAMGTTIAAGADSTGFGATTGAAVRATGVPAISFHHAGYVGTTDSAGFCDRF